MSNIGKILSFVIFVCLFPFTVFAEEKQSGLGFTVTPSFGMLYGQAKEIVYKYPPRSDMLESELQWDIMPLFYVGLAADFGPVDNFSEHGIIGSLSFKMGIPQRTGIMEDRDWEDMHWLPSGTLTKYSRQDNFTERTILADLSLGYSFPSYNFIALGINLDFSYMHYNWIAKYGIFQYLKPGQTWADEIPKIPWDKMQDYFQDAYIPEDGKMISYTQNWFILSPGVFIKFRLGRFFSLNGNFNYSPLIYCEDRDDHLARKPIKIFQDYLYYGHYLKGGGGLTFSPLDNLDIILFLSYSSIFDSRGDAYFDNERHNDIAGGGYSAFDIGLSASLRLSGMY
jgi:outer membrane protease